MEKWQAWEKITYASGVDPDLADQIASIPGGDDLFRCIQCGTCSGMCPLSPYMDYMPRQIIAMIRAGLREEVLSSYTTWLCASCYACTVECPKQIRVTDIMYAAKRLAIRQGVHPKRLATPVLAQEFFHEIETNGRSTESRLLMRTLMRTRPLEIIKQTRLGWKLLRSGRMAVRRQSVSRKQELADMLKALEREHMVTGKAEPHVGRKEAR
jgi:quinone-modifying oxidoreductase subunit QmoC